MNSGYCCVIGFLKTCFSVTPKPFKVFVLLFLFIWMRTTLPRLRYDQLMRFGWKVLLPVATINAVVTAILVVAL